MKNARSGERGVSVKRSAAATDVDEYLAAVAEPARSALNKIRATIRSVAPEATETISYRIPTFRYAGRPLVGFAAFSNHCSLFPMNSTLIEAFKLKDFPTSKGAIRFPVDKPLPAALVKKLVTARVAENERKKPR